MRKLYLAYYNFGRESEVLVYSWDSQKCVNTCVRYHNALPGEYDLVSITVPANQHTTADRAYNKHLRGKSEFPKWYNPHIHAIWGTMENNGGK